MYFFVYNKTKNLLLLLLLYTFNFQLCRIYIHSTRAFTLGAIVPRGHFVHFALSTTGRARAGVYRQIPRFVLLNSLSLLYSTLLYSLGRVCAQSPSAFPTISNESNIDHAKRRAI